MNSIDVCARAAPEVGGGACHIGGTVHGMLMLIAFVAPWLLMICRVCERFPNCGLTVRCPYWTDKISGAGSATRSSLVLHFTHARASLRNTNEAP